MNWLDIAIAAILLFSVIPAVINGLVREIVTLAAVVIGILAALWYYPGPARWLEPYTSSPTVAGFVGFFLIFLSFLVVGLVVSKLLGALLKAGGLRWFDRLLGAAFGLLRGALVAGALVMALVAFLPGKGGDEAVARSRLAPGVLYCARTIAALAPQQLKQGFQEGLDRVRALWRGMPADTV